MEGTQRPNVLIIGAARSGTTALARALQSHPDVFMTTPKETHFFAHAGTPVKYQGPKDDITINRSMVSDEAEFLALFDRCNAPVRLEGSVSTLHHPHRSIPAIRSTCDEEVKLVAILRSPADRAHSAFLYLRGRGFEPLDSFEAALGNEEDRIEAMWHHMWHYRAMSRYELQLPDFIQAFGSDLHLMVLEELQSDPDGELTRLAKFLDLDPSHGLRLQADVNRGGEPRSPTLARITTLARSHPLVERVAKKLLSPQRRDTLRARNLERPEVDPALHRQLGIDFAPTVSYVESVLGRRIDAWHR